MGQADGKYWVANNPNAEITNDNATALAQHKVLTSVESLTGGASPIALAVGTRYHNGDVNGLTCTLPAASASTVGDKIEVIYTGILADGFVHKYGTAGEFFAATSLLIKPSNATGNAAYAKDSADGTGDDFLNLTGGTNAGWGIGTTLTFIFNGSQWHVECWGKATGNGSTAATGAFATS